MRHGMLLVGARPLVTSFVAVCFNCQLLAFLDSEDAACGFEGSKLEGCSEMFIHSRETRAVLGMCRCSKSGNYLVHWALFTRFVVDSVPLHGWHLSQPHLCPV